MDTPNDTDEPSAFAKYRGRLRHLAGKDVDECIEGMRGPATDEDAWGSQYGDNPAAVKACALFNGDQAAARTWMTTPHAFLPGPAPIEQAQTPEGLEEVLRALLRIEHGVFG